MRGIDSVITELENRYQVNVPKKLFDSVEIYTTEDYKQKFEEKWGYSVSGTGLIIPKDDWAVLKETLNLPKFAGAKAFLPIEFKEMEYGFCILSPEEKSTSWGIDHEMLHLSQYENSKGFRELFNLCYKNKNLTQSDAVRRVEAEMLAEFCAFRDNFEELRKMPEASWPRIANYLAKTYLPLYLDIMNLETPQAYQYFGGHMLQVSYNIKSAEECLTPAETTKLFFELPYEEPFKESHNAFAIAISNKTKHNKES